MILHGTLLVEADGDAYERGAGAVVGYVEKQPRVTAASEARVVVVTRADYEAALTG